MFVGEAVPFSSAVGAYVGKVSTNPPQSEAQNGPPSFFSGQRKGQEKDTESYIESGILWFNQKILRAPFLKSLHHIEVVQPYSNAYIILYKHNELITM